MPIAPHENNEVRLVLGGHKPIAAIEKLKQPVGYGLAISLANAGMLSIKILHGEVVITKPNTKHLLDEYETLVNDGVALYGLKGYHRRMGKMFGYSDKDISDFINSEIVCDCRKCSGI